MKTLITPEILKNNFPRTERIKKSISSYRQQIIDIIQGKDHRLLVIVGPCSIHDYDAAMEYANLLSKLNNKIQDSIFLVMRTYFEKPRTTFGWKGLISDPYLDGSFQINEGLALARKLLLDIHHLNLPTATEFLDVFIAPYISDLISWGAVGARTVESQMHRELASGLPLPIGFKNNQDGNVQVAMDAIKVSQRSHYLLTIQNEGTATVIKTTGNPNCHVVLRGSYHASNYHSYALENISKKLIAQQLNPRILIDCSHGNSAKDPAKQVNVLEDIYNQIQAAAASFEQKTIMGVMLESNLIAGKQALLNSNALIYGQSITDGCIGWEETQKLLEMISKLNSHATKRKLFYTKEMV